jgi:hypothetical protein
MFEPAAQAQALSNFRKGVCDRIMGQKPKECGSLNGATSVTTSVLAIVTAFVMGTMFY